MKVLSIGAMPVWCAVKPQAVANYKRFAALRPAYSDLPAKRSKNARVSGGFRVICQLIFCP
ncbi:hypothetical protein [Roseibium sp. M-1]